MKYLFHQLAIEEYRISADWYKERSLKIEKRFINNTNNTIETIIQNPEFYKIIKGNKRIAKVKDFPFSIIYIYEEDIFIISVFHHSRNPKIWKER